MLVSRNLTLLLLLSTILVLPAKAVQINFGTENTAIDGYTESGFSFSSTPNLFNYSGSVGHGGGDAPYLLTVTNGGTFSFESLESALNTQQLPDATLTFTGSLGGSDLGQDVFSVTSFFPPTSSSAVNLLGVTLDTLLIEFSSVPPGEPFFLTSLTLTPRSVDDSSGPTVMLLCLPLIALVYQRSAGKRQLSA